MGFTYQLPAIVGGTVLVIEQIQSQNYVTNVSGWAIFADGTAEFLNITIRGEFTAGDPAGAHITMGGTDSPNGIAFYTGDPAETFPGLVNPRVVGTGLGIELVAPATAADPGGPSLQLVSNKVTSANSTAHLDSTGTAIVSAGSTASVTVGSHGLVVDSLANTSLIDPIVKLYDAALTGNRGVSVTGGYMVPLDDAVWHTVGAVGEPAFKGNWAVQAGFTAGFYKDATGRVQLRGRVQETVASSTIIYTLPTGYRPTQSMSWLIKSNNDASTGCWVSVSSIGDVSVIGNTAGARIQTILDAISFPTF